MRPNIFDIATKELSQDAFITWLLRFADESCQEEDKDLHQCAQEFVRSLIQTEYSDYDEKIVSVKADRQLQNIDVWAVINNKYFIVIEDKTNTSEHSQQLERYKDFALHYCKDNNYYQPVCIYIKTGNESRHYLKKIEKKGFSVFGRKELIAILEKYKFIKNNIFQDFLDRLLRLESLNNQFTYKEINQWGNSDWQGFYQFLEDKLECDDMSWGFANNPNGGFFYLCFSWLDWKYNSAVYMQLEQDKKRLCFKVQVDCDNKEISTQAVRNKLYHLITKQATQEGILGIKKPDRFGNGEYMTFAVIEREGWFGNECFDGQKVLENLAKYQAFFEKCIRESF